jgi:hypothetical protein
MTFEEFLPEYLEAHADRRTRLIHTAGTLTGLAIAATAIARREPKLLLVALASGYVPAWLSHWIFEGNQPKTFKYPLLSLRGDIVMAYRTLRGQPT